MHLSAIAYQLYRDGSYARASSLYQEIVDSIEVRDDGGRRLKATMLSWIALSEMMRQQFWSAEVAILESLELDPSDVGSHLSLARILCKQGRLEDALAKYKSTLEMKTPEKAQEILLGYGTCLFDMKRFPEALQTLNEALGESGQDRAQSLYMKGLTLMMLDRDREAYELLDEAKDIHPEHPLLPEAYQLALSKQIGALKPLTYSCTHD